MAGMPHKFTAVATALVVALAHLAGACPAGASVGPAAPVPALASDPGQRCCNHIEPAARDATPPVEHRERPESQCRHCGGAPAAALTAQPDHARTVSTAAPSFDPFTATDFTAVVVGVCPQNFPTLPDRTKPPAALSPPTLLGLCCALNL